MKIPFESGIEVEISQDMIDDVIREFEAENPGKKVTEMQPEGILSSNDAKNQGHVCAFGAHPMTQRRAVRLSEAQAEFEATEWRGCWNLDCLPQCVHTLGESGWRCERFELAFAEWAAGRSALQASTNDVGE